jgi:hypothetical protein
MILIGISGKRGTGKDSLASILRNKYGFLNLPFAEELKSAVREEFRLTRDHTDGWLKETPLPTYPGFTPREIMIRYGQFFRQFDKNWWVEKVFDKMQQIKTLKSYGDEMRVSISDVRFINEAQYIKKQGGILVRLERKPELNIYKGVVDDISETDLDLYDNFDYTIDSDHNISLSDLEVAADMIVANEKVGK